VSPLLAVIIFAGLGIAHAAKAYWGRHNRIVRKLAEKRQMPAGGVGGDQIRVVGRVKQRAEPLRAPISGRPCVAFQADVEELQGEEWISRLRVREAQSFLVVDETGSALVDANGPFELGLVTDEQGSSGLFGSIGAAQLQVVKSHLSSGNEWFGRSNKARYREGILKVGQLVAVGGNGAREITGEAAAPGLREAPTWLVLRGTADDRLLISNSVQAIGGRWNLPQRASVSTSVATKKATET
jgi:hypothetical protein